MSKRKRSNNEVITDELERLLAPPTKKQKLMDLQENTNVSNDENYDMPPGPYRKSLISLKRITKKDKIRNVIKSLCDCVEELKEILEDEDEDDNEDY